MMLSLPQVCRRMHQETALLVFNLTTFRMPAYMLGQFIKSIGGTRAYMIRSLILELHEGLNYTDDGEERDLRNENRIHGKDLLGSLQVLGSKGDLEHVEFIFDDRNFAYFWMRDWEDLVVCMRRKLRDLRPAHRIVVEVNLEEMDEFGSRTVERGIHGLLIDGIASGFTRLDRRVMGS